MRIISDLMIKRGIKQHKFAGEMPSNFKVVKAKFLLGYRTKDVRMMEEALASLPNIEVYVAGMISKDLKDVINGVEVDTSKYCKLQMEAYKLCRYAYKLKMKEFCTL